MAVMVGRSPSLRREDPIDVVIRHCRGWLRFDDPRRRRELSVKVASYDGVQVAGGEKLGCYLPALREAQMHWAAKTIPTMFSDTAFAIRDTRERIDVMVWLRRNYDEAWEGWRRDYPFRSYDRLLDYIAELMAQRLGDNPL